MSGSLAYLLDTNILSDLVRNPLRIITPSRHASRVTRHGTPIRPNDLLIAANALTNDLTVITANVG
jgi:predicted nucleic acid-binding protein